MEAALNHLRAQGIKIRPADLARLSPLIHKHIHMLGRYAFTLPEPITNGALHPQSGRTRRPLAQLCVPTIVTAREEGSAKKCGAVPDSCGYMPT